MPIDGDDFKACMARWASGVTVVTTRSGEVTTRDDRLGFQWCFALTAAGDHLCCTRGSITTGLITESRLLRGQRACCRSAGVSPITFASKKTESNRFEGIEFTTGKTGSPLLDGVVVNMDCKLVATHEAGDHFVYIGEIEEARYHDREPLIFYCGGYRTLAAGEG